MQRTITIFGCGWLGAPLGAALAARGYSVNGTTTRAEKLEALRSAGVRPFLFKLGDASVHADLLNAQTAIVCIPPGRQPDRETRYVEGVRALAALMRGSSIANVLFVSSTSVYPDAGGTVGENDAVAGNFLVVAENVFRQNASLRTTVVRFAGLVGPGRHPGRFLSGKSTGGASQPVNLIHRRDAVGVILRIVDEDRWGYVLNGVAPRHPTREAFYTAASRDLHLPPPVFDGESAAGGKTVDHAAVRNVLAYDFVYDDPMTMDFNDERTD